MKFAPNRLRERYINRAGTQMKQVEWKDNHAHFRGWIIYWRENQDQTGYDLWLDDEKGDDCFHYDDCQKIDIAIELASGAINAVIDGDFMTKAKYLDPLSNFDNSLTRQILRSDQGFEPIIDRANYEY